MEEFTQEELQEFAQAFKVHSLVSNSMFVSVAFSNSSKFGFILILKASDPKLFLFKADFLNTLEKPLLDLTPEIAKDIIHCLISSSVGEW